MKEEEKASGVRGEQTIPKNQVDRPNQLRLVDVMTFTIVGW